MFSKNQSDGGVGDAETIIGASVKVEGNFVCQGNMVIDGEVKGIVKTDKFLSIGPKSVIIADVAAGNARIAGEVRGKVVVDGYLELSDTAKVTGDIVVNSLSIAKGATLNGRCSMKNGSKASEPEKEVEETE